MKKMLLSLLLSLVALPAFAAGSWSNVTVTAINPLSAHFLSPNGVLQVQLSAASANTPSCVGTGYNIYAWVDLSTPGGMLIAAVLQYARISGQTVTVIGNGTCGAISYEEEINYVTE